MLHNQLVIIIDATQVKPAHILIIERWIRAGTAVSALTTEKNTGQLVDLQVNFMT